MCRACDVCMYVCVVKATNRGGVEWLRRHVKSRGISVHSLIFKGLQNCHADATFMPLSESRVCTVDCRIRHDEQCSVCSTKPQTAAIHCCPLLSHLYIACLCHRAQYVKTWCHPQNLQIYNILQRCRRRIKPHPPATCAENVMKFVCMISETCMPTDRHIHDSTPLRDGSDVGITSRSSSSFPAPRSIRV